MRLILVHQQKRRIELESEKSDFYNHPIDLYYKFGERTMKEKVGMHRPLALPKIADPTFLTFLCRTVCEQFGRSVLQNQLKTSKVQKAWKFAWKSYCCPTAHLRLIHFLLLLSFKNWFLIIQSTNHLEIWAEISLLSQKMPENLLLNPSSSENLCQNQLNHFLS